MAQIRLTKTQLRLEQGKLNGYRHFLPTLKLKKALLQQEIADAVAEQRTHQQCVNQLWEQFERFAPLFSISQYNPLNMVALAEVKRGVENIAGIEVPRLLSVRIDIVPYSTFDTPVWLDGVLTELGAYREAQARWQIATERVACLQEELRQVSIRVNLFEKVLIPRAHAHIRKIKIFLGDQELTAIGRAKIAKSKRTPIAV